MHAANKNFILEVGEKTEEIIFAMGDSPLIQNFAQGLSVQWLLNQMGREDFPYDRKNRLCNQVSLHAANYQRIYDDHNSKKRHKEERSGTKETILIKDSEGNERYGAYTRDYNIMRAAGLHLMSVGSPMPLSAQNLLPQLKCPQGHFYIGLEGPGKSSYAIAASVNKGLGNIEEYGFFDASYGCFLLRSQERFDEWLNFFLHKSGYGINVGYTSAYVCSIGAWW